MNVLTSLLLAATLLAAPPSHAPAFEDGAGDPEALAALRTVCETIATVESYTFELTSKFEGGGAPPGGRGGRGAGFFEPPRGTTVGEYQKDGPMRLEQSGQEIFTLNGRVVYKDNERQWTVLDPDAGFGGGRGRDRGDDDGGEGDGRGRGRRGGFDFRTFRNVAALRDTLIPHDLVSGITGKVTEVQAHERGGGVLYVATLSEGTARTIVGEGEGDERRGFGGPGGGRGPGPDGRGRDREDDDDNSRRRDGRRDRGDAEPRPTGPSESSGEMKILVGSDGHIDKIEIEARTKAAGSDSARERHVEIKIKKVNKTKVRIPKEALAQMG